MTLVFFKRKSKLRESLHVPTSSTCICVCSLMVALCCSWTHQLGRLCPPHLPFLCRVTRWHMPWRQSSVETQVLQAALQDMAAGNVKPVHQLCKNKPEARVSLGNHYPRTLALVILCASVTFQSFGVERCGQKLK